MYDRGMELDLARIRQRLEDEAASLRAELDETTIESPEPMTYGSQAAAASQVFDQNRAQALHERAARQLRQVEEAIGRIDAGAYGRCQRCGRPIDAARLEALPWAAYDLDCQRQLSG